MIIPKKLLFFVRRLRYVRKKKKREYPHQHEQALVRLGNSLCQEEQAYQEVRKVYIQRALEKLLEQPVSHEQVPTIACITSGGGLRAAFSTLGFLKGLENSGILDTTMYLSCLSGSTWVVGTWLAHDMSLAELDHFLCGRTWSGLRPSMNQIRLIAQQLREKYRMRQPITMVDIFGALLANRFLTVRRNNCHKVYLSEQAHVIAHGQRPFPIYTAISADDSNTWYEFTPYEIGAPALATYVPSWAYGRLFFNGVSIRRPGHEFFPPEQSLGFHFGTFGAGFTGTLENMYAKIVPEINSPLLHKTMHLLLPRLGQKRISKARVHNFMAGIQGNPLEKSDYIYLSDAGFDFNLPYPPISGQRPERKADIIIIMDVSRTIDDGFQLKQLQMYAQKYNLPMPTITTQDIEKNIVTVLKDETNPNAPVIIYFPRIKDESVLSDAVRSAYWSSIKDFDPQTALSSFCRSVNFNYTPEQAQQVAKLMECNVMASKQVMIDAIRWAVNNKK